MNINRLGPKTSKEKPRPKSVERVKSGKGKSSDVEDGNVVNEEAAFVSTEQEAMVDHLEELRVNRDCLQSVMKNFSTYSYVPLPGVNHSPQPPKQKPKNTVTVRKLKPCSKLLLNKPKERVYVAKLVATNENEFLAKSILEPVDINKVKPYNILGSVSDFKHQAAKERQQELLSAKSSSGIACDKAHLAHNNESNPGMMINNTINQTNALNNWNKKMKERQKQQKQLSKHLDVELDMLVMNQCNSYRTIQEERTIIDGAMAAKDYGKGYRVGSEFWRQVEEVGGEDGISITLGKTEKGVKSPLEHVGQPTAIKSEMGVDWTETGREANIHKPWWNSDYLHERQSYFKDVIDEMDPHKPYIEGLEVIGHSIKSSQLTDNEFKGTSSFDVEEKVLKDHHETEKIDPLSSFEDVYDTPIFGPSLLINGHSACWEGPRLNGNEKECGVFMELNFNCDVKEMATFCIDITNNGTASIKYNWNRQPIYDPFEMKKPRPKQRFYFDACDGIILPGDTVQIPFLFKSPISGIFQESWVIETHPVLCGGKKIEICLHGIATEEDQFKDTRVEIQENLEKCVMNTMIQRLIQDLVNGIQTPPRPSTPSDHYKTEADIFSQKNENLVYHHDALNRLKAMFNELRPDEDWDMSIHSLYKTINDLEEEQREECLERFNKEILPFNHSVDVPVSKSAYDSCYQVICETIDKFAVSSINLKHQLGIAEKEFVVKTDVVTARKGKKGGPVVDVQKATRNEARSPKKDTPTSKNKKDKGKAIVETPPNAIALNKDVPVLSVDPPSEDSKDITAPPSDIRSSLYQHYMEKMYGQMYHCLQEMADNLSVVLEDQGCSLSAKV